jgi:hypothetical protein
MPHAAPSSHSPSAALKNVSYISSSAVSVSYMRGQITLSDTKSKRALCTVSELSAQAPDSSGRALRLKILYRIALKSELCAGVRRAENK